MEVEIYKRLDNIVTFHKIQTLEHGTLYPSNCITCKTCLTSNYIVDNKFSLCLPICVTCEPEVLLYIRSYRKNNIKGHNMFSIVRDCP